MAASAFGTLCLLWATVAWAAQPPQLYSGLLGSSQLLSLAQGAPERAFQIWAQHHKKEYADEQTHKSRFAVWQANVEFIRQHQASGSSMQLALNEFADLSWEEFSQGRLGLLGEQALKQRALRDARNKAPFRYASTQAPNSMDWRDKGAVTDVKNQGQCGSCWSFSTTGAIEGVNAIATGELVALSEEQLVDCDTEKNMGCGGGLMDWAYEYVVKNGGLDTEVDFPYWSGWGMTLWRCNRRKEHDRTVVTIDGFEDVPADEASLLKAAANQPISVGICASSAMQFYSGGIIDKCCDGLNHGVLVVGYGEDERDGTPYWLVKNSWGGAWGAEGYFKLKRNVAAKGGLCGIATAASYPVKTSPNHPVPQMCDMFGWTECGATATCSCSYKLFGWWCVWHDCCPLEQASTCDDGQHCCPNNAPICDTRNGVCTNADGTISVPWTAKEKANTFAERMPQRAQEFARFAGKAEPYPERPLPPQ